MTDHSKVSAILSQANVGASQCHPIWICSTLTLLRNLEKFNFPSKLDDDSRKQIMGLISTQLMDYEGLSEPQLFKMDETSARDKELLFEHFLATHPFVHAQRGEGFIIDKKGTTLAVINMEDHLELTRMDCGDEPEKSFESLVKLETDVGKTLNYAFSSTFGFLTTNPAHAGTGFLARAFLQVPGIILTKQLETIVEKHKTEFINIAGLTGSESSDFVGNVVMISNAFTLGITEEKVLSEVRTFATHLLVEEKGLRARLQTQPRSEIRDQVGRAYGLLKHSYQIETFEALNALSLLKLGLDVNWISGITHSKLNELFFNCRRAHLLFQVAENTPQEELARQRAIFLQKGLEGLQLAV
ncbi:MAG: hypothetical protein Q8K75_09375 [Chlamydiales bacterium]|nr:hypothetical protein [Chlamydiales bacterium]